MLTFLSTLILASLIISSVAPDAARRRQHHLLAHRGL